MIFTCYNLPSFSTVIFTVIFTALFISVIATPTFTIDTKYSSTIYYDIIRYMRHFYCFLLFFGGDSGRGEALFTREHVDVLPDALNLRAVVEVCRTDGLPHRVPVGLTARLVRNALLSHDVKQLRKQTQMDA